LISEGIRPETVIKCGSTMREVLTYYRPLIDESRVLEELTLSPGEYFLVSVHREENVDAEDRLRDILATLRAIADQHNRRVIVSTHPRTRRRLEDLINGRDDLAGDKVSFLKPFGFLDYVKLQMNAFCVLSDSGTITEECSLLGFPAITLRDAHERPEGMDAGILIMSGVKAERVLQSIDVVTSDPRSRSERPHILDYQELHVSKKVVRIIYSYVDYVRRTVWGLG
jgi:UDP-N-acetylglucosamine 2-epimerase (non-hydrolysing)